MSDLANNPLADDDQTWRPWRLLTPATITQWCLAMEQPWDEVLDGLVGLAQKGYLQLGYREDAPADVCWIRTRVIDWSDEDG